MALTENTVSVNNLKIQYLEDGQDAGRTLLLVHGGLGDARLHWEPVIPMLAGEGFRVLAPHLPGFGQSQVLPTMQLETLLDWLKSFLTTLNVEQAVVVGSSLGALIARLFAAGNPQLVPAVILLNGGGVPDIPQALRVLERIPVVSGVVMSQFTRSMTDPQNLQKMIADKEVLNESFTNQARAATRSFTRLMRMLVASPLPEAQNPLVPTLVLWGADDSFTPLADGEAIKNSIPGATLTEIAGCGHLPQLETPDVFVWQVSNFLEKLSRPQRSDLPGAGILPDIPSG